MSARAQRRRDLVAWVHLNALWLPLNVQDAALMAIAVPAALVTLAPKNHVVALAVLASLQSVSAMLVPPVAGWLSDRRRRAGGGRRTWVAVGLLINVIGLVALAYAGSLWLFTAMLILATGAENIAIAGYQAMLPELIPRANWGVASGVRGLLTLIGTFIGLASAGLAPEPRITFLIIAAVLAIGSLSLLGIDERVVTEASHATVRDHYDFIVVFWSRAFLVFGMIMLQTFVLYFFRDVLKVTNATAGTAGLAACAALGALISAVYLGILSDRVSRKLVTAAAGLPMAAAAIGFAIAPNPNALLPIALLFGLGFGGVLSAGWALALDSIPELGDVARDLGIWGIASNFPNVIAPLVGGWILVSFHGTRLGYQVVFATAGVCYLAASAIVLKVRAR